ncbi:DTW domain-containing protein [Exilibacterium tricleocarpae]|uniref:tRNA-uridine aminocarboxypropyltransferase n=1 Tax=Exilibacterium tricleocarpae TaxID=2591008 RepID=A0A545TM36_9GAMM|nr:tRNA-uridine aminocarboxypropyltransferase [Exilibacterium tricleocarpae]TQV78254.1 DTW domain-containing protein [Exilibacterium tricleocarpae]
MATERRRTCARCRRPQATCLCDLVVPVATDTEVLILQHPQESGHPKGSAQLLYLSLSHSTLWVGETFDATQLAERCGAGGKTTVLLYPPSGAYPCRTLRPGALTPGTTRLVVLDGTWRKTRKLLHLNPLLQQLPHLALQPAAPAGYLMRKAPRPHQRSTLEATCQALAAIEDCGERLAPLQQAFATLNRRFLAYADSAGP